MFGMGMTEILLILAIALIVIGPKKLPEIAKSLGRAMGEFKRATNDLKQSLNEDMPDRNMKPIDVYAPKKKENVIDLSATPPDEKKTVAEPETITQDTPGDTPIDTKEADKND